MKVSSIKHIKSIALILIGTMLFSCENDMEVVKSLKIDQNTPYESSYNVDMDYYDSGKLVMQMQSPEILRFINEDETMEMPQGITMIFYDSLGKVKSKLTANYAINYVKKKIMKARNHVVATNSLGKKLLTEELIWNQNTHKIYTDKQVKVVSKDKVIFGDGLTSDESFTKWAITHPTGDIILNESLNTDSIN